MSCPPWGCRAADAAWKNEWRCLVDESRKVSDGGAGTVRRPRYLTYVRSLRGVRQLPGGTAHEASQFHARGSVVLSDGDCHQDQHEYKDSAEADQIGDDK